MTTAAPTPAFEVAPDMAHTPDTAPQAPHAQAPPAQTVTTAAPKPTLRGQIAENPLVSFFGAVIVVLLTAAIAGLNIRISDTNDRIDRLAATMEARFAVQDKRIDRLDAKIDQKFDELDAKINRLDARIDQLDAKIDRLDAKFDEMNLKLTALIAALNATDAVNASGNS